MDVAPIINPPDPTSSGAGPIGTIPAGPTDTIEKVSLLDYLNFTGIAKTNSQEVFGQIESDAPLLQDPSYVALLDILNSIQRVSTDLTSAVNQWSAIEQQQQTMKSAASSYDSICSNLVGSVLNPAIKNFNDAATTFNLAQAAFNGASNQNDTTVQSNWQAAQKAWNTAKTTYTTACTNFQTQLNSALGTYNTAAQAYDKFMNDPKNDYKIVNNQLGKYGLAQMTAPTVPAPDPSVNLTPNPSKPPDFIFPATNSYSPPMITVSHPLSGGVLLTAGNPTPSQLPSIVGKPVPTPATITPSNFGINTDPPSIITTVQSQVKQILSQLVFLKSSVDTVKDLTQNLNPRDLASGKLTLPASFYEKKPAGVPETSAAAGDSSSGSGTSDTMALLSGAGSRNLLRTLLNALSGIVDQQTLFPSSTVIKQDKADDKNIEGSSAAKPKKEDEDLKSTDPTTPISVSHGKPGDAAQVSDAASKSHKNDILNALLLYALVAIQSSGKEAAGATVRQLSESTVLSGKAENATDITSTFSFADSIHKLASSDTPNKILEGLFFNPSNPTSLPADKKDELLPILAAAFKLGLLNVAISHLSSSLDLPGLLNQVLQNAGVPASQSEAGNINQVLDNPVSAIFLKSSLTKSLLSSAPGTLTRQQAESIVNNAVSTVLANPSFSTPAELEAAFNKAFQDQGVSQGTAQSLSQTAVANVVAESKLPPLDTALEQDKTLALADTITPTRSTSRNAATNTTSTGPLQRDLLNQLVAEVAKNEAVSSVLQDVLSTPYTTTREFRSALLDALTVKGFSAEDANNVTNLAVALVTTPNRTAVTADNPLQSPSAKRLDPSKLAEYLSTYLKTQLAPELDAYRAKEIIDKALRVTTGIMSDYSAQIRILRERGRQQDLDNFARALPTLTRASLPLFALRQQVNEVIKAEIQAYMDPIANDSLTRSSVQPLNYKRGMDIKI